MGTNNAPGASPIKVTVSSSGYKSGGSCGTTTTYTRYVYATAPIRKPYTNSTLATHDEVVNGGTFTTRLALSDNIFQSDIITAISIPAAFYTDGSANTNNAYSGTVTNNSTLGYSQARAVFNWSWPGWQRVTSATYSPRGTGFSQYPMNEQPLACVVFTVTDLHSHTATSTVSVMS